MSDPSPNAAGSAERSARSAPVLHIARLCVRFEGGALARARPELAPVLSELELTIGPGRIVGLVGESGAGKSLTALAVMGLLPPAAKVQAGTIAYLGRDLVALSEPEYDAVRGREIAIVFQQPGTALDPYQRAGAQLAGTLRARHRPEQPRPGRQAAAARALELLAEVGFEDPPRAAAAFPHELSGGQQQRVMIALALSGAPRLLIADEPTTALDTTTQAQILGLLRRLCRERGMAMLLISHDLALVAAVADAVAVLWRGRIIEQGPVAQVLARPAHPYTRALLACRPRLGSGRARLPTLAGLLEQRVAANGAVVLVEPAVTALPSEPAPSEHTPLLRVEGLVVRYPRRTGWLRPSAEQVTAVDGVSFELHRGRTLGLVGDSGCGKSSVALAILRLVRAHAGRVLFREVDVLALDPRALRALRRSLQIVFQDPTAALDPRQHVQGALLEAMTMHRVGAGRAERLERAAALLSEVGLASSALRRYPHELSGGERQRVAVARALAVEPELLVCDEAVASLDVSVQAQVLNLLKDLCARRGLACLFISHASAVVEFMADRVAVMSAGKLVELGPAAAVCAAPQSAAGRALVAALPELPVQS